MNWDSGLGFQRWHQSKKLGLTQQALIGIASAPSLSDPQWQRYAKYMFDRSLEFYARTSDRDGGIADALFFNVHAVPQGVASARLGAARVLANAARAIDAGLGRARSTEPPALYSFDPDIGRLAVTTPAYNTAIVAVNQRAFPYGGLDLARLFDGNQDVAANIGGTPPASFGALVRDVNGRRVLASQVARTSVDRSVTPLQLTKAPSGAGARAASATTSAYAGPFTDLRATGTISSSAGVGARVPSVRPEVDPDALGHHAPRLPRAERRHPVPEHGSRPPGERHRGAQGRVAGHGRRPPDRALARVPAGGQEPVLGLHRHAALASGGRRGAHPAPGRRSPRRRTPARRWPCRSPATSGSRRSRSRRASRPDAAAA